MSLDRDRFDDRGEIGRGGLGVVRKTFDRALRRMVAVKSLLDPAADAEVRARFAREAQICGQLDHPNIIPIYDVACEAASGLVEAFAMKLIEGTTFADLIHAGDEAAAEPRRRERLLQVFLKVCDAIAFAHSRGVVHRDLKPQNVMVGAYGEVYVTDWGSAIVVREAQAAAETAIDLAPALPDRPDVTGALTGTLCYMAPEQAHGRIRAIDARTDVFGLGGMLYELLTRQPPYAGTSPVETFERAKAGRVPPPDERAPDAELPRALCRVAMRALAVSPDARHQTVAELKADIESFIRGGGWFETRQFAPGAIIVREGERDQCAYVVEEGRCEVYRTVGAHKEVLRAVGPGEVFGEVALFTSSPRIASVAAVTAVKAVVVTPESLAQELESSSWLRAFIRTAAERFAEADRRAARAGTT
jgi:eukaryotic-like serine/threonine-protein kinase